MLTTSIKNAVLGTAGRFRNEHTPIPPQPDGTVTETNSALTAASSSVPQRISVLLVDDEPVLLEVGKTYLERTPGITVTVAGSGEDALQVISTDSFDAIVSDYQMPGMDGIAFLKEVRLRSRTQPFIIFTGKGREEVVIEALNHGADYYVQKGGEPKSQYAELLHKIHRAVRQRRAETALKRKHEILRALLASSPSGIAFVRNRTLQWVNESMATMLGYTRTEMKGMHLMQLYENEATYDRIGDRIQSDLRAAGRSKITTRFRHKAGFSIDTEIHTAPLDRGNLHFGHMLTMTDISEKLAVVQKHGPPAPIPHLELSPVIELDHNGGIIYYNDAAIEAMIRYGSRGTLEEFFPADMQEILTRLDETDTGSVFRNVRIGVALFRVHITLSARFQVIRLSATRISDTAEDPAPK